MTKGYFTLPETNGSRLEMYGWNTSFLWKGLFSGAMLVSGRVSGAILLTQQMLSELVVFANSDQGLPGHVGSWDI